MRAGRLTILALVAVIAAGAAVFAWTPDYQTVTGDKIVSIDVSSLGTGGARLFGYTDKAGDNLRFILTRGDDGKAHSVFDACRQCYTYHRGYKISGNEAICRVCGNRYPIGHLTEGKASCVPVGLPIEQDSETVRIKTDDLKAGHWLF
ncbi:MAG TPA: Fe-S-containing protein [Candidatus Binataceae bacterium]|nr:Fe-S-containing protein [Candidatus Binataceae bacterium]